jgi:hypothetical protein
VGQPDFIIAGAMRAGTTALADALAEHPGVHMTTPKEPNYFAVAHGALSFTGPGDQWFAQQNTADWTSYQALFPDEGSRVRGEASAMYLALPGTAASIAAACPDVRIVLTLRDPVERAYSAYLYLRSKGREPIQDFTQALSAEADRRAAGYGPMWWYAGASRYDLGMPEFMAAFDFSQLLVITNEQLRRDPVGTLALVCDHIGAGAAPCATRVLDRTVNGSGVPRAELMTRFLHPPDRLRGALSRLAPPAARAVVRRARVAAVRPPAPMPAAAQDRLRAELAGVLPALVEMRALDTSEWTTAIG